MQRPRTPARGHSHTASIDYDGVRLAVDIGFIVYNELNYPDLTAMFAHLGVETVESCMSFAVTVDTRLLGYTFNRCRSISVTARATNWRS
ncbi:hypothetical protein ACFIOY_25775 [Bradyrhizobium sp. TZ2]